MRHASKLFSGSVGGLQYENGRWFLEVSVEYWTIARVEISQRDAMEMLSRYSDIPAPTTEAPHDEAKGAS